MAGSGRLEESRMNRNSTRLALFYANAGHVVTHLLMLLYPTVVLALERLIGLKAYVKL